MPPQKESRISNIEWGLLFGAYVLMDSLQFLLDFFAIGLLVNRYIDIVAGGALLLYLKLRGVLDSRITLLICASFVAEEIPIVDIAPFWTFDIWKIRGWVNERSGS